VCVAALSPVLAAPRHPSTIPFFLEELASVTPEFPQEESAAGDSSRSFQNRRLGVSSGFCVSAAYFSCLRDLLEQLHQPDLPINPLLRNQPNVVPERAFAQGQRFDNAARRRTARFATNDQSGRVAVCVAAIGRRLLVSTQLFATAVAESPVAVRRRRLGNPHANGPRGVESSQATVHSQRHPLIPVVGKKPFYDAKIHGKSGRSTDSSVDCPTRTTARPRELPRALFLRRRSFGFKMYEIFLRPASPTGREHAA